LRGDWQGRRRQQDLISANADNKYQMALQFVAWTRRLPLIDVSKNMQAASVAAVEARTHSAMSGWTG
jgi:hypothetical protein